jgi:sugar fermentation stimulation protein A
VTPANIPISGTLISGRFVHRSNRFLAEVDVAGERALAHVPNSGRMTELFVPGVEVLLRPAPVESERRTAYDLLLIMHGDSWVGVDSRLPPGLIVDAWRAGLLPAFDGYQSVRREVRYGESRLDLLFEGPQGQLYVEAKSVNLVKDGLGLFPDAPTIRGARHLGELASAVRGGHRAAVTFVVQRDDVQRVMPYVDKDPVFAAALLDAVSTGVECYAISCAVTPNGSTPTRLVPVVLP